MKELSRIKKNQRWIIQQIECIKNGDCLCPQENGIDLSKIAEFDSLAQASVSLGINKYFRWSEINIDGVPSPNGSQLGVTK